MNCEQAKILDTVRSGANVFFTGPAGSGKSEVVKHIKKYLDDKNTRYAVTAPTGVAAVLIGGRTIHSWSRFERVQSLAPNFVAGEVLATEVLIIDEVSMVCNQITQCIFPNSSVSYST